MSNRIGGPNPNAAPATTHGVTKEEPRKTEHPPSQPNAPANEKTEHASKEAATHRKGEQHVTGMMNRADLDRKLPAKNVKGREFPPDAGNDKLKEIHVYRHKNSDQTITQYPNGVQFKRTSTYTTHSAEVVRNSGGAASIQKQGSDIAMEIVAPPGGKVNRQPDGSFTVLDAKGTQVARMDKDGNVQVRDQRGDYKQDSEGKIAYTKTGNEKPAQKPGVIAPSDYGNYGISTDGHTLRFPNGVEYSPDNGVRVPKEIGLVKEHPVGKNRFNELYGKSNDGQTLIRGTTGRTEILTTEGTFIITGRGQITYEPNK